MKLNMVYLDYVKQRILLCCRSGKRLQQIVQNLARSHKAGMAKFSGYSIDSSFNAKTNTLADKISRIVSHLARHLI